MPASRHAAVSATALVIGVAALGWSVPAAAKTKIIYSLPKNAFGGRVDATDPAGNLYGVTPQGGVGHGTIFELVPPAATGAPWTDQTLYTFPLPATGYPGGLIRDAAGNLYGATFGGEAYGHTGSGTVWELSPPAVTGGAWSFAVLYTFSAPPAGKQGGPDGAQPCGRLARDDTGTLYGTTTYGGAFDRGVVFSLAPPAPGGLSWTQTVLHSFPGKGIVIATCPLTLSAGGRVLYGTTAYGDPVFRLRRQPGGWVYRRIGFAAGTGVPVQPNGGLVIDGNGDLFGTSQSGGAGYGTVFELSPPAAGQTAWTEQTLHAFTGPDGSQPTDGLAVSRSATALFGATLFGGDKRGGVVFRLDPPASGSGSWPYTVLNSFNDERTGEPHSPEGALIFGHSHTIFGTTTYGGASEGGTVFSQTPDFPQTPQ